MSNNDRPELLVPLPPGFRVRVLETAPDGWAVLVPYDLERRMNTLRRRGLSDHLADQLMVAGSPGLLAEVERLSDRAIGLVSTAANREDATR